MKTLLMGAVTLAQAFVPQSATLPNGLSDSDHAIAEMKNGERGWTVPWAMYHDKDRELWLNGNYTIEPHPGGTLEMLVWRDDAGWHVDVSKVSRKQWGMAGYVGKFLPIRVISFEGN